MRILTSLLLLGAAPVTSSPAPQEAARAVQPAAASQSAARANADFGIHLYKRLTGEREAGENVFVSPISVAGAIGPVAAGARGETRTAIDAAMRFAAGEQLHAALGGLLKELERTREGVTLSIANALWVKQGLKLNPAFERIARTNYDAQVAAVDFENAPKAAEERINQWVKEETRGRIGGVVSADDFSRYTRLVITNAVYLLGDWAKPFSPSATQEQPFFGTSGGMRQIALMHDRDEYRYFETETFQAIDLPYRDLKLSMSVFLPKDRAGLGAFEAELSDGKLGEWLTRLDGKSPETVELYLPKLKIGGTYDLIPSLRAMGMGIAFTEQADLRGVADQPLSISKIVQKTFLRMDEKGTEAAAVTGMTVTVTGMRISKPPVFRADHPFFLVIRDKGSETILFLGRVVAPEAAGAR